MPKVNVKDKKLSKMVKKTQTSVKTKNTVENSIDSYFKKSNNAVEKNDTQVEIKFEENDLCNAWQYAVIEEENPTCTFKPITVRQYVQSILGVQNDIKPKLETLKNEETGEDVTEAETNKSESEGGEENIRNRKTNSKENGNKVEFKLEEEELNVTLQYAAVPEEDDATYFKPVTVNEYIRSILGEPNDIKPKIESPHDHESGENDIESETNKSTSGKGEDNIRKRKRDPNENNNPYKRVKRAECTICQKKLWGNRDRIRHERTHGPKTELECEKCQRKFHNKGNLTRHLRSHITKDIMKKCDICDKIFNSRQGFEHHKLIHSTDKSFECEICQVKFRSKSNLNEHQQRWHTEKRHKCTFCDKAFIHRFSLTAHIRTDHFDLLRQQDKLAGGLNELFQGIRTYECYRCNYTNRIRELKRHMEKCVGKIQGPHTKIQTKPAECERKQRRSYECFDCKKTFQFKDTARRHIKLHSSEQALKCNECNLKVYRADVKIKHHCLLHECNMCDYVAPFAKVKLHLAEVHGITKIFECDKCSEKFQLKCNLHHHMRAHKPNETLKKCDVCEETFLSAAGLISHKFIHSNSFECQICQKKFPHQDGLKCHVESKHGKKHKCQFCEKKYGAKIYLSIHIRTNHFSLLRKQDKLTGGLNALFQDVLTYECYRCKFAAPLNKVKKHMEMCKGKMVQRTCSKPAQCKLCNCKYVQKSSLYAHMREVHSIDTKKTVVHLIDKFECFDCKMQYTQKPSLLHHMRLHSGQRLIKCNHCSLKCYPTATKVNHAHILHECNICKYTAPFRQVKKHLDEVHGVDRVFECNMCHVKYDLDIVLKRHKRLFGFEQFQKGWKPTTNARILKITKAHEQYYKQPVKCELCDFRCVFNVALKQHMRDAHLIAVKKKP